jgi:hypothetical protein
MADPSYYAAKIAECLKLLESSNDPLYRDVYQAMADEFAEKYEALKRRMLEKATQDAPASPLLVPYVPPPGADATAQSLLGDPPGRHATVDGQGLALTRTDPPDRGLPPA